MADKTGKIYRAGTLAYTSAGIIALCFWLLWGDCPWALKERAIYPSAGIVLTKQLGVSNLLFAVITIWVPNLINMFLAPAISYISDRHRGKLGRRIPFLAGATALIVPGLFLAGFTHILGGALYQAVNPVWPEVSRHACKMAVFCFGWVILDIGTSLSASLFNALVNDVVPKEILGRFFSLMRMVSLGVGIIFNQWIIALVEEHTAAVFCGVGTAYGLGLLSMCLKIKEGEYPEPPPDPELAELKARGRKAGVLYLVARSAGTSLRQSFSDGYYVRYIIAFACGNLAFLPINSFSIPYVNSLGISMAEYGRYAVITYAFSFGLSFFLGALSDRFHPLRTGMLAITAYALLMFTGYFMLADAKWFGLFFVLHGVISGSYMTFVASLGARLLPAQHFAQFDSATWVTLSLASPLAGLLLGWGIDASGDYRLLFLIAGALAAAALALYVSVYRGFIRRGGDTGYTAPELKFR